MYALAHIGIRVKDLEKSARFYIEGLGGVRGNEHIMPSGSHLLFIQFDGFSVELICKPGDDRTPGKNHMAIAVPDIQEARRRLIAAGYDANEIKPMGSHAWNCFLQGPDGEIIELCQGAL